MWKTLVIPIDLHKAAERLQAGRRPSESQRSISSRKRRNYEERLLQLCVLVLDLHRLASTLLTCLQELTPTSRAARLHGLASG